MADASEGADAGGAGSSQQPPLDRDSSRSAEDERSMGRLEQPMPPSGLGRLQRRLWVLFDDPTSSPQAKWLSGFMMLVILLSIGSFTFASIPAETMWLNVWIRRADGEVVEGSSHSADVDPAAYYRSDGPLLTSTELNEARTPFAEIETFCIMVFSTEYVLRLFASPQGPGVLRFIVGLWNVVDLISIMPWYAERIMEAIGVDGNVSYLSVLRLFRLTRITRIFKMSKNLEGLVMLTSALRKSGPALLMLFAFMGIAGVLFATLIFTFEEGNYDPYRRQYVRDDGSPSPFESIPASLWWTIITMTTVGYGDQYPVTPIGKVIAVCTMFCGLVVLSLPITIIGANFDDEYRELRKRAQDEKERTRQKERARERERQALLRAQQQQQGSGGLPGGSAKATPQRGKEKGEGGGDAAGGDGAVAAVAVPASPAGAGSARGEAPAVAAGAGSGPPAEDPIKIIQTMIHEAHYSLTMEVEKLMVDHENKLRLQIKQVLRRHAAGVNAHSTPLEQMRSYPTIDDHSEQVS